MPALILYFLCYFVVMFTGLVETVGIVEKFFSGSSGAKITFKCKNNNCFDDVKVGDSISVNGVCLTIVNLNSNLFEADIMNESLKISNLKNLKKNDEINLERAMKITSRFDGHIVSGHIDCTAKVKYVKKDGFSDKISFICNTDLIIQKGSIAVNGVSLTVSKVEDDFFEVSLIPETIKNTNLKNLKIGDIVNIEYDLFAKYTKKFTVDSKNEGITLEFLKKNGF